MDAENKIRKVPENNSTISVSIRLDRTLYEKWQETGKKYFGKKGVSKMNKLILEEGIKEILEKAGIRGKGEKNS